MFKILGLLFLIICFSKTEGNFTFPSNLDELYIDHIYNISWNNNLTNYHIYLLHKDSNTFVGDTLSTYENGNLVLDDLVNDNTYTWKVPRDLNYYELQDHNFKLVITNTEGFTSSLTNNKNDYILTDYFILKTNMNVTKPEDNIIIYPNNEVILEWNGFMGKVDIQLEYKENEKWKHFYDIVKNYNTDDRNQYIWNVPINVNEISKYKMRIKIIEVDTEIERYSNNFYSYGINIINPDRNQYDYLHLENNQLNISWNENNPVNNNIRVDLLNIDNNLIINLIDGEYEKNYYTIKFDDELMNTNYKVKISNNNLEQLSDSFLINYLSTTTTTSSTSSLTTTTITTTTITSSSLTTTSITYSTTTSTSSTISTTTYSTITLSSTTTTSITTSSSTTDTVTTITNTLTTVTNTLSTTETQTYTSNSDTITTQSLTTYNGTNDTLVPTPIIDNKVKTSSKSKSGYYIIWILMIICVILILLVSYYFYIKFVNNENNKIEDSSNLSQDRNNQENINMQTENINEILTKYVRHKNPLYNNNDCTNRQLQNHHYSTVEDTEFNQANYSGYQQVTAGGYQQVPVGGYQQVTAAGYQQVPVGGLRCYQNAAYEFTEQPKSRLTVNDTYLPVNI